LINPSRVYVDRTHQEVQEGIKINEPPRSCVTNTLPIEGSVSVLLVPGASTPLKFYYTAVAGRSKTNVLLALISPRTREQSRRESQSRKRPRRFRIRIKRPLVYYNVKEPHVHEFPLVRANSRLKLPLQLEQNPRELTLSTDFTFAFSMSWSPSMTQGAPPQDSITTTCANP
jgi:hypothetical protein